MLVIFCNEPWRWRKIFNQIWPIDKEKCVRVLYCFEDGQICRHKQCLGASRSCHLILTAHITEFKRWCMRLPTRMAVAQLCADAARLGETQSRIKHVHCNLGMPFLCAAEGIQKELRQIIGKTARGEWGQTLRYRIPAKHSVPGLSLASVLQQLKSMLLERYANSEFSFVVANNYSAQSQVCPKIFSKDL